MSSEDKKNSSEYLNIFGSSCSKNPLAKNVLGYYNDMEFSSMAANVSLWVVDGVEILNIQSICIWIILSMSLHVSL